MREYNIVERFSSAQKEKAAAQGRGQEERKQSDHNENAQEERKEASVQMQSRKSINAKRGSTAASEVN
jgi:hypothetical protein